MEKKEQSAVKKDVFEDAKKFILDTGVLGGVLFLLKLKGIITLPFIVKFLGTLEYGIWAQMLVFITYGATILPLGFDVALVRLIPESPREKGSIYLTVFISALLFATTGMILCFLFADSIAGAILGAPSAGIYLKISTFIVICVSLRWINLNAYRALQRIKLYALAGFASEIGEIVIICAMLILGQKLVAIFYFMLAWELAITALLTIHVLKIVGLQRPKWHILKKISKYALPLVPAVISLFALSRSTQFVVGYYLGVHGVALYAANYALASVILLVSIAFNNTLLPKVGELWDSQRSLAGKYISSSTKVFLAVALPLVVGISFLAKNFLGKLANQDIASSGGMVTFLIAAGTLLWGFAIIISMVFHGAKQTWYISTVVALCGVANVLLSFALIPLFGIMGAGLAGLISYTLACVAFILAARKIIILEYNVKYILKLCIATFLMGAALYLFPFPGISGLFVSATLGALVYFSALIIFKAITKKDFGHLKKMFSGKPFAAYG